MTNNDFEQFMQSQIHEIEISKWLASEKAGHDLGNDYVMEWIKLYSKEYREQWNKERGIQ